METWSRGGWDLLKSTTISLVFVVFSCRLFCLHHCTKLSTWLLSIPDTAHNSRVIRELLDVAWLRVVGEVRCVQGEQDWWEHSPLWGAGAAQHSLRDAVFQPDELWSLRQVVSDPGYQVDVHIHLQELVTQSEGLDGIKGTGEIKKHDSHRTFPLVQIRVCPVQ